MGLASQTIIMKGKFTQRCNSLVWGMFHSSNPQLSHLDKNRHRVLNYPEVDFFSSSKHTIVLATVELSVAESGLGIGGRHYGNSPVQILSYYYYFRGGVTNFIDGIQDSRAP